MAGDVTKECENIKVNPNPPKLKFDRDRVHIFQENVLLSEKLEPLKNLINQPEIEKPDIDLCVLKLNNLIVETAIKTCPTNTRGRTKSKAKKGKIAGLTMAVVPFKGF